METKMWTCQWCGTKCVDWVTLRGHLSDRCRVLRFRLKKGWDRHWEPTDGNLMLEDFM